MVIVNGNWKILGTAQSRLTLSTCDAERIMGSFAILVLSNALFVGAVPMLVTQQDIEEEYYRHRTANG